jgi:hypothetical protein
LCKCLRGLIALRRWCEWIIGLLWLLPERRRLCKLLGWLLRGRLRLHLLKLLSGPGCRCAAAYRRSEALVGTGVKPGYRLLRFWIVGLKVECLVVDLQSLFGIAALLHGDAKVVTRLCVCGLKLYRLCNRFDGIEGSAGLAIRAAKIQTGVEVGWVFLNGCLQLGNSRLDITALERCQTRITCCRHP